MSFGFAELPSKGREKSSHRFPGAGEEGKDTAFFQLARKNFEREAQERGGA